MYMLDTDICIYIAKQEPPKVLARLEKEKQSNVVMSAITFAELMNGAFKSERVESNLSKLNELSRLIDILPFDAEAAEVYGQIRSHLEKKGKLIGSFDLFIAAHAKSQNFILVTNNEREFKRVPDLKVENWAK